MTVFSDIYKRNSWNGVESLSGPGSGPTATKHVAPAILALVAELGITSVLDVACGDGYWMPDLPGYVGIDVAPEAIAKAQRRHRDRRYVVAGAPPLLAFDLVIVRDAIQHLSFADGLALLATIRETGSRWLLASTYLDVPNVDIATGDFYSPNLEAEPFSLGPPERLIFDGYGYADPDEIRDPQKHLGLWPLRPVSG